MVVPDVITTNIRFTIHIIWLDTPTIATASSEYLPSMNISILPNKYISISSIIIGQVIERSLLFISFI